MTHFREATENELDDLWYEEHAGTIALIGPRREARLEVRPEIVLVTLGVDQALSLHLETTGFNPTEDTTEVEVEVRLPGNDQLLRVTPVRFEWAHIGAFSQISVGGLLGEDLFRPGLALELSTNFERTANRPALFRLL